MAKLILALGEDNEKKKKIDVWVMDKGITNLEINKCFEKEENQDIKNNYLGVYSMDSITRFNNFYEIMKNEMKNVHLQFLILINTINQALIGGVLWVFTSKKIYYYLIA